MQKKHRFQNAIFLVTLVFFAVFILSIHINKPFMGHHDWNSVVYSQVARNIVRYGIWQAKFGQVNTYDFTTPANFGYITHYPPLLPILMSGSFSILGISEISARVVPIIASGLMVGLIFLLGLNYFNRDVGFLAGIFMIVTPIFIYFGKMPVHESVVPAFSLLAVYGYFRYIQTQKFKFYFLLLLGLVVGGLINWTGYYVVLPIVGDYFFMQKVRRLRWLIITLIFVSMSLFSGHLLHLKILTGKFFGGGLIGIFMDRFNPYQTQSTYGFSLPKYFIQELNFIKIYFTLPLCVLAFLKLLQLLIKFIRKLKINPGDRLLIMFAVYGMTHLLIFQQLVFIHDYMIYYLLPFMCLSAGAAANQLLKIIPLVWFRNIAVVGLILVVAFERANFAKALLDSKMNERGVLLGKFIAAQTHSGELSLVSSFSYKEFTDVFIGFYADRNVHYAETVDPKQLLKYRLIIRPKDHDAFDKFSKSYLNEHVPRYENKLYFWYDTNGFKLE